ncbi:hypothetical protein WJX84_002039 [Apatococcus fuscideae]|uniref:Uncharacterized protein n=1 Tax=Apatococcus fuscideae TaxID=2026836 RepID=A0AAW1RIB3_9CHLO
MFTIPDQHRLRKARRALGAWTCQLSCLFGKPANSLGSNRLLVIQELSDYCDSFAGDNEISSVNLLKEGWNRPAGCSH